MRTKTLRLAAALAAALFVAGTAAAQPPGRPPRGAGGFPPGQPPGGPGGVERIVDDLNLTGRQKDQADEALRAYQDNLRRLTDLARADLLLRMKEVLSERDFRSFKEALDRQPGPAPAVAARRGLTADEVVERVLSFDKNKDGKITKDELPERMQGLIEKGDTNKDGALDRDEIRKLATDLARDGTFPGFGPPGFGPRGQAPGRPEPGTLLPPLVRDRLSLSEEQEKQVTDLEKDVRTKLMKILTDEQKAQLEEARQRGPGGPPFRGPGRDRQP
jgi:Spy/CpxP family protein refolding chaperone